MEHLQKQTALVKYTNPVTINDLYLSNTMKIKTIHFENCSLITLIITVLITLIKIGYDILPFFGVVQYIISNQFFFISMFIFHIASFIFCLMDIFYNKKELDLFKIIILVSFITMIVVKIMSIVFNQYINIVVVHVHSSFVVVVCSNIYDFDRMCCVAKIRLI